ncbi:hypothetical protein [Mycobacterium pseudokansasii]|uniref:Uncharacterized protein n=1 Tax=Mycobacterium pseudokansasii TaxID=2341080 RepID=A0A498QPK2_9MYCO|nr:hypothetical protein [Mycobacterium pseudokansasii]KZS61103.1 hypothetical protein A4G27_16585 [Mycobacterium kansasii]VAZ88934.1 hypothetical protein LAUMK35_00726 [Mycobacterium pseudokansasii]VAZ89433.1 hypothetical protein LAUMK21_00724 [Mycobacterium pseudokansasii]VBA49765.1 hypothetical protein LAUMK142_02173 [Mycobacterium pseudokansasii]
MTEHHDDQPTPERRAQLGRDVNRDLATARRFIATMYARDHEGIAAITREIVTSGRGTNVLNAMAVQAIEFAAQLVPNEDQLQQELDRIAMEQLDAADAVDRFGCDDE